MAYDWENHNRQLVMEGTQALERTSESLNRSQRLAVETEQVGTNVLSELSEQRESLLRTQDRLGNMNEGISNSHRILSAMNRHFFYNKLILIIIIVLESFILAGMLYIKFLKR